MDIAALSRRRCSRREREREDLKILNKHINKFIMQISILYKGKYDYYRHTYKYDSAS